MKKENRIVCVSECFMSDLKQFMTIKVENRKKNLFYINITVRAHSVRIWVGGVEGEGRRGVGRGDNGWVRRVDFIYH